MISEIEYKIETREHIGLVRFWMSAANANLTSRALEHDKSKLEEPEASGFRAMTNDGRLKEMTYGSEEYRAVLREHKPTIHHHYQENDHHPEHWPNGIRDMSLLSMLEMLCDWKASTGRMKDGDLEQSIGINAVRFDYGEDVARLLINTARELGMITKPEVEETA